MKPIQTSAHVVFLVNITSCYHCRQCWAKSMISHKMSVKPQISYWLHQKVCFSQEVNTSASLLF